jgi:hypothetical protein
MTPPLRQGLDGPLDPDVARPVSQFAARQEHGRRHHAAGDARRRYRLQQASLPDCTHGLRFSDGEPSLLGDSECALAKCHGAARDPDDGCAASSELRYLLGEQPRDVVAQGAGIVYEHRCPGLDDDERHGVKSSHLVDC